MTNVATNDSRPCYAQLRGAAPCRMQGVSPIFRAPVSLVQTGDTPSLAFATPDFVSRPEAPFKPTERIITPAYVIGAYPCERLVELDK